MSLEDAFISEARRQGFQPSSAALNEFAIRHAGERLVIDHIAGPDHSLTALADIVSDIRKVMPESFSPVTTGKNLTQQMADEIKQSRATGIPSDWTQVRERMARLTAAMMDERAASRQR